MKKIIEGCRILGLAAVLAAVFFMAGEWALGAQMPERVIEQEQVSSEGQVPLEGQEPVSFQMMEDLQEESSGQSVTGSGPEESDEQDQTGIRDASPGDEMQEESMPLAVEQESVPADQEESSGSLAQDGESREGTVQEEESTLFLEKTALWVQEKEYRAQIVLRAGGWALEDTIRLEDVVSPYWTVDKEAADSQLRVENLTVMDENGKETQVEAVSFALGEEDQYAGYVEFTVPILLKEEYKEVSQDTWYPTNWDVTDDQGKKTCAAAVIYVDACKEEHRLEAESPQLLVTAGLVDFTVEKRADREAAKPGDVINYYITICNTGERTLHSVLSTERFLDAGVQAAFVPQEGVTLSQDRTQALVPKLSKGEEITLTATVELPDYINRPELVNQVIVVTDETGASDAKISQSSITLELPVTGTPVPTASPVPSPTAAPWAISTPVPTAPVYFYVSPTPVLYQGKTADSVYGKSASQAASAPKTGDDTPIPVYLAQMGLALAVLAKGIRRFLPGAGKRKR